MDIALRGIVKAYGEHIVLRNVSLELRDGCSYCLMGPSGSGKTTLLHILMGILSPDAGKLEGLTHRCVAPVFQDDRLCENLSAGANIRMTARERLTPAAVEQMLENLGLPGCLHKPVRELSGGMKRRVAIARALCSGGDLFLFDEPFKGLDDETKRQTIAVAREACADKTTVWVTHDERDAEAFGGSLILLPL